MNHRVEIAAAWPAWHSGAMMIAPLDQRILMIDGEAIVVDKPAGLPVDRPRDGTLSVEDALESLRFGFGREPGIVHRLDRDTSGCLLLARNPKAHRRFSAAFEAGAVTKTYIAVLDGVPEGATIGAGGRITMALAKRSTREAGWRIVPDAKGKSAETDWTLLGVTDGFALVRFRPHTGRTHQLRVHAAAGLGVPILGDAVYGRAGEGLLLHALSLELPRLPKPAIVAHAPLPERFARWAEHLDAAA